MYFTSVLFEIFTIRDSQPFIIHKSVLFCMLRRGASIHLTQDVVGAEIVIGSNAPKDFNELLVEAIDSGLSSLGESPKAAIYFLLESKFGIQKHEIPNKLEAFSRALEKVFKDGTQCLVGLFLKNLNEKAGGAMNQTAVLLSGKKLSFQKCIELAKSEFEKGRSAQRYGLELADSSGK